MTIENFEVNEELEAYRFERAEARADGRVASST